MNHFVLTTATMYSIVYHIVAMCYIKFTMAVAKDVEVFEDKNEMTSPLEVGDDVEANNCAVLLSILSDGHYNISAEDCSVFDSVISVWWQHVMLGIQ